ncbi:MAG: type VI secretion system-associated FHA domain protein TagH [Betaproteobacteria bacterium]|nr:type VI secretion system-associated FHA domain protein TagH [Betaproteobacteria bacterium]
MLEIIGLTYNDLTPVVPVAGTISGNATIGRGHDNDIILPDPKRLISRQHLKFTLGSDNVYRVSDIGSGNPVFINGEELASGKEHPLQNHDKILVGGYVLQVTYVGQGREDAPRVQPASPPPPSPPPSPSPSPVSDGAISDDFLADLLGSTPAQGSLATPGLETEAQGELIDPFQYGATTSKPPDIMQALNAHGIEPGSLDGKGDELICGEDVSTKDTSAMIDELLQDPLNTPANRPLKNDNELDPLAMFGENRDNEAFGDILQAGKGTASNVPPSMNLTHGSELGALFQLPDAGGGSPSPGGSPAAPVAQPHSQPGGDAALDISSVGGMGMVHGSELDAMFGLPGSGEKPPAVSSAPAVEPPGVGARSVESADSIASFDDIDSFITGLGSTAEAPAVDPLSGFLSGIGPEETTPPPRDVPPARSSVPEASGTTGSAAAPGMEELYRAFIEGLGMELPGRAALDKAFMNMLGQALRNYTQGSVELIAGRTVVKQAVRANVTVIAPERNNPLKFAPDVSTAVLGMFGRTMPGFMGPVEAIRNAFVDLRAHQIGVISGMQAALNHVLDRFNPAMIGDKIPPLGVLENVFSVLYKARLWEEYGYYFHALREKASDHFHEFFGEAFVEAYEKAILTVQSGEKAGRS